MKSLQGAKAIMFHHFDDNTHPKVQGSINKTEFVSLLQKIMQNYKIIEPRHFTEKIRNGNIEENEIVITFDDSLKSQFDVAYPILKQYGLKAFFFIYSAPFESKQTNFEIYRHFRTTQFENIESFYQSFFSELNLDPVDLNSLKQITDNYLSSYNFYTINDKIFRYLRDFVLKENEYEEAMKNMMKNCQWDENKVREKLWMNNKQIQILHEEGNEIGLHSYSHPMVMSKLNYENQLSEYQLNYNHIKKVLGNSPNSMSHPCGDFNENTKLVLNKLNITIGFDAKINKSRDALSISRIDHSILMMDGLH